jgi:rRNA maturation endonuclease Nob1
MPGIEPGKYLNNYQGSNVVSVPGDVSKIIDYYKWLVGDKAWEVIEQVISYWIVCPGVKMMWAIVLISKAEGAGKQLLALLISSILGDKNVKTNVSFDKLIDKHSTILEGKQVIVLNEVVMLGTGSERKLLANKLKPYISDPTLIINPKNKPMIEIPNLCNFFIFSNEENALHLTKDTRRYYVVNIKRKEEEILQKLEKEGIKNEILRTIKSPGALKNYFENIVKIKNKDIFFSSAPKTEDLQDMIDRSKGDFDRILDMAKEYRSFPFTSKVYGGDRHYGYSGLVIRDEMYPNIVRDPLFNSVFKTLTLFEDWLKENCTPWPDGKTTKQIKIKAGDKAPIKRRRAYLIHNDKLEDGRHLRELSDTELGDHHNAFGYVVLNDQEIDALKRRSERAPEVMTEDLDMARVADMMDHSELRQQNKEYEDKFEKQRETGCWSCKQPIDTETDGICEKCNFGIPCGECGKCACDNPSSKLYKKVNGQRNEEF